MVRRGALGKGLAHQGRRTAMTWTYLVGREDLGRTRLRAEPDPDPAALGAGEALFAIERFSLTANNITYGAFGDRMGYWRFFPSGEEGWGIIPVWGFATVTASRAPGIEVGARFYGYWPMASHHVGRLEPRGRGAVDGSPHRADLAAAYNRYEPAEPRADDDLAALLRPLFLTSFLIDDLLADAHPEATIIVSSASSRTALGLGWLVSRRGGRAIGLTSPRHLARVGSPGLFARAIAYESVDDLPTDGPAVFVDLAGDPRLRRRVHEKLGANLQASIVVGTTHLGADPGERAPLPGPKPTFFFAPERFAKRLGDWGAAGVQQKTGEALSHFIADSGWLRIVTHRGPEGLAAAYARVLAGAGTPDEGDIVVP
ncbi:hypothetical protein GCM10007925_03240 [Sphingomonas astaxanthinifaciens DSM 22298]|uniref:DUF2855 domain-containing protein n=2 Tax=Sphingomonas TaxID=13687 RepID=A0ABQ5Z1H6_9SPHN|nr:hypothetical protein GCM10007925_03240 [Sphingomonas astaxanthinifaciens DSM 22298]